MPKVEDPTDLSTCIPFIVSVAKPGVGQRLFQGEELRPVDNLEWVEKVVEQQTHSLTNGRCASIALKSIHLEDSRYKLQYLQPPDMRWNLSGNGTRTKAREKYRGRAKVWIAG